MKVLALVLLGMFLLASSVFAEDGQINLTCPASVKAATPNNAIFSATVTGNLCPSISFARFVKTLIGNTSNATLGQIGIVGPISESKPTITVNCGQTSASKAFYVPTPPASMANTTATLVLQILDNKGLSLGSASCSIPVVP